MTHWTEQLYEEQAGLFAEVLENRVDQATDDVEALLQLLTQEHGLQPERVLDVACGVGRHVLAFADAGCYAEGVDISAEFIDRARTKATEQNLEHQVDFYRKDMRELDEWDGSYDLITNFWNSLGYYDKPTDVAILRAMRGLLSDEGAVTIEMGNKEFYVNNYSSSSVHEVDGHLHVSRKDFELTTGRFHTTVDVFSIEGSAYEYVDTMEFQPRLYAPVELKEMCERAGFTQIDLFGGFDGSQVSLESSQAVVLAR